MQNIDFYKQMTDWEIEVAVARHIEISHEEELIFYRRALEAISMLPVGCDIWRDYAIDALNGPSKTSNDAYARIINRALRAARRNNGTKS